MDKPLSEAELLARKFHDLYESLVPQFGYQTNEETRKFDPTSKNGRLMIAVCHEILADRHEQLESALAEMREENAALREKIELLTAENEANKECLEEYSGHKIQSQGIVGVEG